MAGSGGYRWGVFLAVFVAVAFASPFFLDAAPYASSGTGDVELDEVTSTSFLYQSAAADHYTQGYCTILPCYFPEGDFDEPRDSSQLGGFVLGADLLTGENFHYPHSDDDDYYPDGHDWETSMGYTDNAVEVGIDNVEGDGLQFYRGGIEGEDGRLYHLSAESRSAWVNEDASGDCRDEGTYADESYDNCDLYVWTPELAFRFVHAYNAEFAGTIGVPLEFSMERYWVVTPEDDWCRTSLVQECLRTAGYNNADADMERGFFRTYWLTAHDVTLADATFGIDEGVGDTFPLEWNCDDRGSDHEHNRDDLPGCY